MGRKSREKALRRVVQGGGDRDGSARALAHLVAGFLADCRPEDEVKTWGTFGDVPADLAARIAAERELMR